MTTGPDERTVSTWRGDVVAQRVADHERYERMHAPFGAALMSAAHIEPGHYVLDVGCGLGGRTLDAAQAACGDGSALGVDLSGAVLEAAEARAVDRGLGNVAFKIADAEVEDLGNGSFDVVLSQFGVMFFSDMVTAFANLRRSLRPGGRLVFTCWQALPRQQSLMVPLTAALEHIPVPEFDANAWSHAAFSLADPSFIKATLLEAGFEGIGIQPVVAPQFQGSDLSDVLTFLKQSEFAQSVFSKADASEAIAGWNAIASAVAAYASGEGVFLDAAAWLVTATRPTTATTWTA